MRIALGQRKGRLTVEFASVDDLNRILDAMHLRDADARRTTRAAGADRADARRGADAVVHNGFRASRAVATQPRNGSSSRSSLGLGRAPMIVLTISPFW